jgi:glycosyltransferase involved in cell wall biosynthesis
MESKPKHGRRLRVGVLDSHPIQYHAPWYRGLARECDLHVFYAHRQTPEGQAAAGYGVAFEWDRDLLSGYESTQLTNVSRAPNVYGFGGCDTPEIGAHIERGEFDAFILNGWYLKSYLQALWTCRRIGVPVLVRGDSQLGTPRSGATRAAKELAHRALLRQFDGYLTVGQRNREYLLHYGADPEAIFFVPHFVDADLFARGVRASGAERDVVRRTLGAGPDGRVALFVGRLVDFKRPGDLIDALALSPAPPGHWSAAFVGTGPLEDSLRRQAEERGVKAWFLGFRNQSELPAIYAAADALVLPSDAHETWGLVVNEAMACGTPAVVSDAVGCAPDMVDEGRTGEVFPCGSAYRLAAAITRISGFDPIQAADALRDKTAAYSCETAVRGTLEAVTHVVSRRH